MQLSIEAYQALKAEMVDNRASVAMLIRVVREQADEIARLRARLAEVDKCDLFHIENAE